MLYLSEIKRAKVVDPAGTEIGRLVDVAVVPKEQFPAVQWAILRTPAGERIVRWTDLERVSRGYRLKESAIPPAAGELPPEALRLGRDLVDKQIVDIDGRPIAKIGRASCRERVLTDV